MYRNVYFHKVVRSAEGMVKLALQRAKRLAVQDRLEWPGPRDAGVYKSLLGQRFTMDEFRNLDDVSVWHCFKVWTGSADGTLNALCRGLLFRGLYKTIELTDRADDATARRAATAAATAVVDAGGDPDYDLFYDAPADRPTPPPASPARATRSSSSAPDGSARPFADYSPLTRAMNQQLGFRRLHVNPRWRDLAAEVVDAELA